MATDKSSFLLYCDIITMVEQLPNEKAGELFKHILNYVNDKNPVTDDLIINISFEPIKQALKRDLKKYESICNRNKLNGLNGGRPKNPEEPKKPTGLSGNPEEPKKPDSDIVIDIDSDIVIDIKKKGKFKFTPPTFEEVKCYCSERNKNVNPQKWHDHYTSNGWMVGKTKMQDWKAAVRTWENETTKTQINGTHKQSNNTNEKPAGLGTHQSLFGS